MHMPRRTELLYMDDSYIRKFSATAIDMEEDAVALDKTAFYPGGGGLPSDTGIMRIGDEEFKVPVTYKKGDLVYHILEGGGLVKPGEIVEGEIDWDRRYRLMRMHTGLHVLGAIFYERMGALVTGNQIGVDRSRVDVNIEGFKRELIGSILEEANRILSEGRKVKIYYLPREEALRIPGIVKLAGAMPPNVERLRIVEVEDIDIQADGGPHVANTNEIGKLVLLRTESKGRRNKRIYFTLEP